MEIFISWSGERSKAVAKALRSWLPKVIQRLKPWMSDSDIDRGSRWLREITDRLHSTNFGIICLTPENLNEPWVLFEAGALSKSLDSSLVCPILLDMNFTELIGPLAQFQATQLNKNDLLKLMKVLNVKTNNRMQEKELEEAYDLWWPKLDDMLKDLPPHDKPTQASRSPKDLLQEILGILRRIDHIHYSRIYDFRNLIDDALLSFKPEDEVGIQTKYQIMIEKMRKLEELKNILGLSHDEFKKIEMMALSNIKCSENEKKVNEVIRLLEDQLLNN